MGRITGAAGETLVTRQALERVNRNYGMHDLTAFQRELLYVIAELDSPHGLQIKDVLAEYYGTEIHHGRLYPNLDTLVEKGLVEKGKINDRTNSYTLTQRGQRQLHARRDWENQSLGEITWVKESTA